MDIPRIFTISESAHRIHNPFTPEKYATPGQALRLKPHSATWHTHVNTWAGGVFALQAR